VVGVHGVGGTWGALATGIFATKLVNEAGGDGLLAGNPGQLFVQLIAVVVTIVLGFVVTTIVLKILDGVMGLRVTAEEELAGLDLSQHSETAYSLGGGSYGEYAIHGAGGGGFQEAMRTAEAKRPAR
jgi:ammonium transporter, Amt family